MIRSDLRGDSKEGDIYKKNIKFLENEIVKLNKEIESMEIVIEGKFVVLKMLKNMIEDLRNSGSNKI